QSRDYPLSAPVLNDVLRVHMPINYVFSGGYRGFICRIFTTDDNGNFVDLSNYFFDVSDPDRTFEFEYQVPDMNIDGMNWGKYIDISFPSPGALSSDKRRGVIRPDSINYNLTEGVGVSEESPVFI